MRAHPRPPAPLLFVLALAFGPSAPSQDPPPQAELVSLKRIWAEGHHNAFTDLIRFRDEWFCCFREGEGHVSPDGALRILVSKDGESWTSAALVRSKTGDLRDPKLTITPDGQLQLCAAEAVNPRSRNLHQSYIWFSANGRDWGEAIAVGDPNVWLWRVQWHAGAAYGIGYATDGKNFIRLYRSADGRKFEKLADRIFAEGEPNESSLAFLPDGTCVCLLRRDDKVGAAQIGTAKPPYTEWSWKSLGARIGGPHVLRLSDGRLIAGVRLYDKQVRTAVCSVDPATGAMRELLALPSGGDTSYPGLVHNDGLLWVSYYSSHEGKTSIYLAKVRLPRAPMERVGLSPDRKGFALLPSGRPFVPWGFNYDHDEQGRLLEDYWEAEWPKVEADFAEMRELGANVVRIHLQLGRFLPERGKPSAAMLDRLSRLLALAESTGLYLDLTGLGCYRKSDVPAWYDALEEKERWEAQAEFWSAVAARCAKSPAVFFYDLMNEPVVSGGPRTAGDWLGPPFAGKYHYVQFVSLDPAGRKRQDVARAWAKHLVAAIRAQDRERLISVGLVDWSLDRPGLTSGFVPEAIAPELDFLCVHLYPRAGKLADDLATLQGFAAAGKPVVIEETFPLHAPVDEFRAFLKASRESAAGWIGFYWGKTPAECRASNELADKLVLGWLEIFQTGPP